MWLNDLMFQFLSIFNGLDILVSSKSKSKNKKSLVAKP